MNFYHPGNEKVTPVSAFSLINFQGVFFIQGLIFKKWLSILEKGVQLYLRETLTGLFITTIGHFVIYNGLMFPSVSRNVGVPTIYPLYTNTTNRVLFTMGSWYLIYSMILLMRKNANKVMNESLFIFLQKSSFIVFLINGFWISMTMLYLVNPEKLKEQDYSPWQHNYYVLAVLNVLGSVSGCYFTYLVKERIGAEINRLQQKLFKLRHR
jgi:hypothetical protein